MKRIKMALFIILLFLQHTQVKANDCDGASVLIGNNCYIIHKDKKGYERPDGCAGYSLQDDSQELDDDFFSRLQIPGIWLDNTKQIPFAIVQRSLKNLGIVIFADVEGNLQLAYDDASKQHYSICSDYQVSNATYSIACSWDFTSQNLNSIISNLLSYVGVGSLIWFKGILEDETVYNAASFVPLFGKCAILSHTKEVTIEDCNTTTSTHVCQHDVLSSVPTIGHLSNIENSSDAQQVWSSAPTEGNLNVNECLEGWTKHYISYVCFKIFKGRDEYSSENCQSIHAVKLSQWDSGADPEITAQFRKEGIISASYNKPVNKIPGFLSMYYVCSMAGKKCSTENDYDSVNNICANRGNCPPKFYAYGSDCLSTDIGSTAVIAEDRCIWNGGLVFNDPEHKAYLEKKRVETYVDVWGGVHNYKWNDVTIYDYWNKITGFQCKDYYYMNQSLTGYISCASNQQSYCYIKNEGNCPIGFNSFLDICLRIISQDECHNV